MQTTRWRLFGAAAMYAAVSLALTSCATTPVSLSASTIPITSNDIVTAIGPASGSAWGGMLLFIPLSPGRQLEPALERALKSSGGDALVNVKVEFKTYFLFVGIIHKTEVYGTAVKVKKGGALR